MASGSSSGSPSSGEDLRVIMDQRKRKRMISNRESARRSRMRKQKQLDELTAQVGQIGKENEQIAGRIDFFTGLYMKLSGENGVLRAQASELRHRLDSLNEIIRFMSSSASNNGVFVGEEEEAQIAIDGGFDCWSFFPFVHQPIMAAAAADMFMC